MSMRAIDPLLFRNHNELSRMRSAKKTLTNKDTVKKSFADVFKNKVEVDKKNADLRNKYPNLSSNIFQRNLTHKQVKAEIHTNVERKKIYDAAVSFEAFFVEKMFKEMKKNIGKNKLIDGGMAEDIFSDMLLTERVGSMASQQDFGLAELIYQQMTHR